MDRVREFVASRLKERDISMKAASRAMGRNSAYLQQYLERGVPAKLSEENRARLAPVLGCAEEDLRLPSPIRHPAKPGRPATPAPQPERQALVRQGENQNRGRRVEVEGEPFVSLPRVDARAAAGAGGETTDEVLHRILFRMDFIRSVTMAPVDQLAVIEVDGDSMEPTLRSGDTALIDCAQRHPDRKDGLYILRRSGGLQVKRVSVGWKDNLATIKSDNPDYPTETGVDPETLDVQGRVLWIGRRV